MKFGKRYDENYDPKKNYVVMDDETMTEQQGYKTNSQLYEEMVRSGKLLAAHNLGMSYEEYLDYEDEEPFETRYELDITEQEEILENYKTRLKRAVEETQIQAKNGNNSGNEKTANSDLPNQRTESVKNVAGSDENAAKAG